MCVLRLCHRSVARIALGVTWTSRTKSAPWAARHFHTTVIDAAGAIYVIGGFDGIGGTVFGSNGTPLGDVWVSTDGGADRTRADARWVLRGTAGIRDGYSRLCVIGRSPAWRQVLLSRVVPPARSG